MEYCLVCGERTVTHVEYSSIGKAVKVTCEWCTDKFVSQFRVTLIRKSHDPIKHISHRVTRIYREAKC